MRGPVLFRHIRRVTTTEEHQRAFRVVSFSSRGALDEHKIPRTIDLPPSRGTYAIYVQHRRFRIDDLHFPGALGWNSMHLCPLLDSKKM